MAEHAHVPLTCISAQCETRGGGGSHDPTWAMSQQLPCSKSTRNNFSQHVQFAWNKAPSSFEVRILPTVPKTILDESQLSILPVLSLASSHRFLDSLVVRISACHVEGPGSIPGRGEIFCLRRQSWHCAEKIYKLQVPLAYLLAVCCQSDASWSNSWPFHDLWYLWYPAKLFFSAGATAEAEPCKSPGSSVGRALGF